MILCIPASVYSHFRCYYCYYLSRILDLAYICSGGQQSGQRIKHSGTFHTRCACCSLTTVWTAFF